MQGRNLFIDHASGEPTCKPGVSSSACRKDEWKTKLVRDIFGNESKYDFNIPPEIPKADYNASDYPCVCGPEDPKCVRKNKAGTLCLVCESSVPCGPNTVQLGINFFKIHTINLRTSQLWLSVWMRQIWSDHRLDWDPQCYGDTAQVVAQAKTGSLEEAKMWVPDLELYNSDVPIGTAVAPRIGTIYGCWDGKPSRGGCGYIFYSAPFILKALCKYVGIVEFPYDQMACEIEFSAWTLHGFIMDIIPRRKTGGISWVDDPNYQSLAGLTAGSSYQDYEITNITVRRMITQYDCCVGEPWPTMLYKIEFNRSQGWYEEKLILPMCILACLSFLTFWLSPDTGERFGFGITVILALLWHDITASGLMPICQERTLTNYLSLTCIGFATFAAFETSIVLWLHYQDAASWRKVVLPRAIRMRFFEPHLIKLSRASEISRSMKTIMKKRRNSYTSSKEAHEREQYFRTMFTELDSNCSGFIEADEFLYFASFIMGSRFKTMDDALFLRDFEHDADPQHVGFQDFVNFCETKCHHMDDTKYLRATCALFLQQSSRRHEVLKQAWMQCGMNVDSWARFSSPLAFAIFILVLYNQDIHQFTEIRFKLAPQLFLMLSPLWPIGIIGIIHLVSHCRYRRRIHKLKHRAQQEEAGVVAPESAEDIGFVETPPKMFHDETVEDEELDIQAPVIAPYKNAPVIF